MVNQGKKNSTFQTAVSCKGCSFNLGSTVLLYTDEYTFLGFILNEHLPFKEGVRVIVNSAGRALGSVPIILKLCKDLGFCTSTQLYKSSVCQK